ncbi:MAG: C13 family peptidase [Caulobacteraceae bacterium]
MPTRETPTIQEKIRAHAFGRLSYDQRQRTNLYASEHVFEAGEPIGPDFQKITAARPSLVVFADDNPRANFGHDCRYLLYAADSGEFQREVAARFPPIHDGRHPIKFEAFHAPLAFQKDRIHFQPKWPIWRCPRIFPEGNRYAILYSGMSNKRHLNDMEFLYRTLVDVYGFDAANIYVCSYDCSLNTQDGVQTKWPGDNTAYRIKVNYQGNRAEFELAVDAVKARIGALDTLLIHCNNHGDYDGTPGTSFLCTYPNWGKYYNADFSNKLAELPKFRQLIVMLEQCNSGGFNASILAKSPADCTSVASAAIESQSSYVSADGNWDPFARDWIAAQAGHDCFGGALAHNPDVDGDGKIEAEEAFGYAKSIQDPADSPNYSESSEAGGDISLGQEYIIWWWWCLLIKEELEAPWRRLPPEEYYANLHRIGPELAKLTAELDATSDKLKGEMKGKIAAVVGAAFK